MINKLVSVRIDAATFGERRVWCLDRVHHQHRAFDQVGFLM